MNSYNKVIITGNLTRDPEMKTTPTGVEIASFCLALNRMFKNQTGEAVEETAFVDCTAFGKQAELIGNWMGKGRPMLLEGRLKQDTWQNNDGKKRSKITVVCEKFHFMDSKQDASGFDAKPSANPDTKPSTEPKPSAKADTSPITEPFLPKPANKSPIADEDVPF